MPIAEPNEPRWTTGPWTVKIIAFPGEGARGFSILAEGKKRSIASIGVYEHETGTVASQYRNQPWAAEYYTPEELVANGHLMAAAKDLYTALEDMISGVYSAESVPCGCIGCKTDRAKAALAKARDEAPEDGPIKPAIGGNE